MFLGCSHFSNHDINFMGNLVDITGKYKSWDTMKYEYNLIDKETFRWVQQVHAIPKLWVEALNKDSQLSVNLAIYDHNLIKICQFDTLDKLVTKELYKISLCSMYEKPTPKILESTNLNWNEIYILPRKVSIDTNLHVFQYTILNSILFLNKSLFKFKKVPSPLYSFCKSANETLLHFFCNIAKRLWNELQYFVSLYLYIPEITQQDVLFDILQSTKVINYSFSSIICICQENMELFRLLV